MREWDTSTVLSATISVAKAATVLKADGLIQAEK